jgi:prepilin-type N-terminal cleavage/methylation domain-containing protein
MMRKRGLAGFTLLEISVALAIASSALLTVTAAGKSAMRESRIRKAHAEVTAIDAALNRYMLKRGRLPVDLDGDGVAIESEILSQLVQWSFLPRPVPAASGLVLDPWETPYVIVLSRDYVKRAADVLCDASGRPYNDGPNSFQVYSRVLEEDTYTANFGFFSNVSAGAAYPGVPDPDVIDDEPVEPTVDDEPETPAEPADPVEPTDPTEPTVPPTQQGNGHGHHGCGCKSSCLLITIALMRQADTSARNADVYINAAIRHSEKSCGKSSVTASFYATRSVIYVGAAAMLAARAAQYDPCYASQADGYASRLIEYRGRAAACGAHL